MIRVLLSKSTCSIMKFANRVIVSANRKCTWNSREIRTWKRVVLMGKRLKIIYIKILWGGKYNKYIIKFVLWDCFFGYFCCRSLYGFVDWNLFGVYKGKRNWSRSLYGFVDWNNGTTPDLTNGGSRSLYGFVDWNAELAPELLEYLVEAYTASWIEISAIL